MSVSHPGVQPFDAFTALLREPSFWTPEALWWVGAALIAAAGVIATVTRREGAAGRPAQWCALGVAGIVLILAFVSPIAVLARGVLFSAHMLQHVLLLLVLPLALYAALPRRWGSTAPTGSAAGGPAAAPPSAMARLFAAPLVGGVLGVGAMWFWHDPAACDAALASPSVAIVRDLSLVLAGLAFWYPVLTRDCRLRLAPPLVIAYLMTACVGCSALGVVMTFTTGSVCPAFGVVATPAALEPLRQAGFSRAVDQQLGGLLMWVPPCVLYAAISMLAMAQWYRGESPDGAATAALSAGVAAGASAGVAGRPAASTEPRTRVTGATR